VVPKMVSMEFASLLQSISVICASISVILGINAWRREYVGKRRIELAEDVLTNFYEARDAIRRIRSPFGFLGEGKSRQPQDGETENEKRILDKAYVVIERREKENETFNKLQASRYRFMARFGPSVGRPFDDLSEVVSRIVLSAHTLGTHYWREEVRQSLQGENRKKFMEEAHQLEAVLMQGLVKPDPIDPEIERIIQTVEEICRPIIDKSMKSIFSSVAVRSFRKGAQ
jgi:hypothetical protein